MQYTPKKYTLSNGINVILDPMPTATTAAIINLGFGANIEQPSICGIAHFVEHMLCRGTTNLPTADAITNHIGNSGGIRNAYTSYSQLCLAGHILSENITVLLETLADMLQNSLFAPNDVETERQIILDEYRRSIDNSSKVFTLYKYKMLFSGTRMETGILGTPETIQSFSSQQLKTFLTDNLNAQNMSIVISGAIHNTEQILTLLNKLFSFVSNGSQNQTNTKISARIAHNNVEIQQNVKLSICFQDQTSNDIESRPLKSAVVLSKQILQRRLFSDIRHNAGLAYGISLGKIGDGTISAHTINTETSIQNIENMITRIAKTCHSIVNAQPITENELQNAKMVIKFKKANTIESAARRCELLSSFWHHYHTIYNYFNELHFDENSTVIDVMNACKGIFVPAISIITQGPSFKSNLEQIWYNNFK